MKKLTCCLLLMALLLSACGSVSPQPTQSPPSAASSPLPEPTAQPAHMVTPEPVVIYDALSESGSYADDVGNSYIYLLRIPAIQAPGTDATRLNQELFTFLYPYVLDAKNAMAGGFSLVVHTVDYQIHINEQMISLVCEVDNDWGQRFYHVVNFDAGSYSEVMRPQLLQRFGLTEESFLTRAKDAMEAYFADNFSGIPHDAFYADRHDQSVAEQNFREDCQLFVNDGGRLCMIVKIYSFAGADYYYHIMEL